MLTIELIEARRATIAASPDLTALRNRLIARAGPVLSQMPIVPRIKALLSRDGGICPDDHTPLAFDPWQPDHHRCPRCGRSFSGERHHAHWARAQHLWVAERAAHLAALHAITGDAAHALRSRELLQAYGDLYFELPNRDNVLGPSHLFFSTYLESIWVLNYFAAACLLRECGALAETEIAAIDAIADEAATVIADFNEGLSNRQVWNSAALTALASWFGDEELAVSAIEGRTGLLGQLADGFGSDGLWYEGENYHLFALRGLLLGMTWARSAGAEVFDDARVAEHLGEALMAPADTALPDLTFPARKDSRYGVSLAHPAYLECWEAGFTLVQAHPAALPAWLRALYAVPAREEATYDAYLNEAGETPLEHRTRSDLSWWALLTMAPELPAAPEAWSGRTRFLEQQGLAVIRRGDRYVSLECGSTAMGHGHPDRLHLTVHANGTHWLPDPGTGSYVSRDLFWYRSTLAHNAPLLDQANQPPGDAARCIAFEASGEWTWCMGLWNGVSRTIVAGPGWVIDIVRFDGRQSRRIDLPWHLAGAIVSEPDGTWEPDTLESEFADHVERLRDVRSGMTLEADDGPSRLRLHMIGAGDLVRAQAPGVPGTGRHCFYLRTHRGNSANFVTVIDPDGGVDEVTEANGTIRVREGERTTTVQITSTEATITSGNTRVVLTGLRPEPLARATYVLDRPVKTTGVAMFVDTPPALDGTLSGFDRSEPLPLDEEYHYFRTEEAYPGPDEFAAMAYVNWTDDLLFVAVDVTKAGIVLLDDAAAPLLLDNEPDDINSDSVQIYLAVPGETPHGWLLRPAGGGALAVRAIGAAAPGVVPHGAWRRTDHGYRITVAIPAPHIQMLRAEERPGFDVIVNEMRPGRVRRAGQLIWSGGPGWAYLRGDRHDPAQFGELEIRG